MAGGAVELVGAVELRAALARLGDQADDPKVAQRAAELVADAARDRVPVKSGDLLGTIHVEPALPAAVVVAGSPAIPYAGVQEYGWPARGIEGSHYLEEAADDKADDVAEIYAEHVGGLVVDVGRSSPL